MLSRRIGAAIGITVVATVTTTALWVYWPGSNLTRQEAIQAARLAPWGSQLPASLITGAKLIHRFDLPKVIGQDGATDAKPFDRVWIVVVKGQLIPSTMGGPASTYTIEVIRDAKPARVELYSGGDTGDRPSNWNDLLDLAPR
jgi:hypothetical protein